MKITKAIIENFRCFHGLQMPIEFDTNGKITLIYGLSGSGKTTMLDFFNWTFYGIEPKEKNKTRNNKPLYNIKSMEELNEGFDLNVSGTIVFEHKNIEYKLKRTRRFKKSYLNIVSMPDEVSLLYRNMKSSSENENIGFIPLDDKDIKQKINEIVPQSLSRYFFFAGEDGGALATPDSNLANSIYSLFDLKKYDEAIRHIGEKGLRNTILGQYAKEKADCRDKGGTGNSGEILKKLSDYSEYEKTYQRQYDICCNKIEKTQRELNLLHEEAGRLGGQSADSINAQRSSNEATINREMENISKCRYEIGKVLANTVPYILLSEKAVQVRNALAYEVNQDNERRKQMDAFVDLNRPLLEDVKKKQKCICGRKLDIESAKYIEDTLNLLPPSSYALIFQQFINSTKNKLYSADAKFLNTEEILNEILGCYDRIDELTKNNADLLKQLASLDESKIKEVANKIEKLEKDKRTLENYKQSYFLEKEKGRKGKEKFSADFEKASKFQNFNNDLDDKIEIIKMLKDNLQAIFEKKKTEVKTILEKSIKEVYAMLATKQEDFTNKNFLKQDFSLRDEYKSGGQELIDVYSYVIGMVKALNETNNKDSEFPIIVDAPFSKTDEIQLSHVIETMPKIVSQVAFFTFDKIRIKEFADTSIIGSVWELKSDETQENTYVMRGEL